MDSSQDLCTIAFLLYTPTPSSIPARRSHVPAIVCHMRQSSRHCCWGQCLTRQQPGQARPGLFALNPGCKQRDGGNHAQRLLDDFAWLGAVPRMAPNPPSTDCRRVLTERRAVAAPLLVGPTCEASPLSQLEGRGSPSERELCDLVSRLAGEQTGRWEALKALSFARGSLRQQTGGMSGLRLRLSAAACRPPAVSHACPSQAAGEREQSSCSDGV